MQTTFNAGLVEFTVELARKFDSLRNVMFQHLIDNDGELLPHVLLADYLRTAQCEGNELWVRSLLEVLEDNFSGDEDDGLSELLSVSFLEHLDPSEPSDRIVIQHLGTRMRAEHDKIFGESV